MGKAILAAFVAAALVKLFLFDVVIADGNSMEPAIHSGEVLLVNRMSYGLRLPGRGGYLIRWSAPANGDVVIFFAPSGGIAVKRSAGIGDGGFWAMGDNRRRSYDSRSFGPVSPEAVIGRVMGVR
jgi:signal peptidase I